MGEPKREIDLIRLASVLLLLAISVLALVGCLGEEEVWVDDEFPAGANVRQQPNELT